MAQIKATAVKNTIAPLDLTPTGRIPAIVAAAAERPDAGAVTAALPGAVDAALRKVAPEQAQQDTCTVWPGLCTETGDHDDHANHTLAATETGWPVSVGFVELTPGRPLLYVDTGMANDFDPEATPMVAAQLRAAADALEAMHAAVKARG
jgi:hypothetical protein